MRLRTGVTDVFPWTIPPLLIPPLPHSLTVFWTVLFSSLSRLSMCHCISRPATKSIPTSCGILTRSHRYSTLKQALPVVLRNDWFSAASLADLTPMTSTPSSSVSLSPSVCVFVSVYSKFYPRFFYCPLFLISLSAVLLFFMYFRLLPIIEQPSSWPR